MKRRTPARLFDDTAALPLFSGVAQRGEVQRFTQREVAYQKPNVLLDAAALSSGTLAGLTGYNRYQAIDQVQAAWVKWVVDGDLSDEFPNWAAAWSAFVTTPEYAAVRRALSGEVLSEVYLRGRLEEGLNGEDEVEQ